MGQHAEQLDPDLHDRTASAPPAPAERDGPDDGEWIVLRRLARSDGDVAMVVQALERVGSLRDRSVLLELRTQLVAGDPSPAVTVAARYDMTPEAVRQVASRVRQRLRTLAASEPGFAPLADLPLVA